MIIISTRLVTFVEFLTRKTQAISWFTTKILPSQEVWYTLVSDLDDVEEFITWRVRCSIQKNMYLISIMGKYTTGKGHLQYFLPMSHNLFCFPNGAVASARRRHETTKQTCWNRDGE